MMKTLKYISSILLILLGFAAYAQQDPMFTQYMTNPVTINPAIAGSREASNLSMVFREQWVGVEGAPTTFSISFDGMTKNNKVGLGSSLIHDRIGPVIQTGLYLNYAYHLQLQDERKLSFGLMGGANYYQFNLAGLIHNDQDDDIPVDGITSRFLPNFGIGAYYYSKKYFAGLSLPKLLRNSLSDNDVSLSVEDREERHLFAMAGMLIDLNENVKLKPSLIGRFINGAPVSLDLNATFMLYDKVWLGAMYRLGVSWGGLVRWQLNENLHLGYSFDFNNARLRGYNNGTHEIFISYTFNKKEGRITSPRYF